jgi:serralysin
MILFRGASLGQFQAKDFQLPLGPASLGPQTFSENFDSAQTLGANWQTNFGYAGNGLNSFTLTNNAEQQIYASSSFQGTGGAPLGLNPFSFNNGILTISATPVSAAQSAQMWGYHYASGMLESNFSQTYGYFEMRAELPHGQGLWPAFWLLGANNNEIDVLEGLGSDTKTAYNAVHSPSVPALGNASFNPYATGFHTYGVLWTPQTLTYTVDGSPVWQTATPADMNSPMHMIVNLAVGGNWPGSPDASTPWPADMHVDYIRAYALPGAGSPPPPPISPPPPVSPPPPPVGGGVSLTSAGFGSTLAGGAGGDTLTSFQGNETMTGGGGADVFRFRTLPWNPTHITDFQAGVDKLDVSGLYVDGYQGTDPLSDHHALFVSDGHGGTAVLIDVDGSGAAHPWPDYVADLEGVSPVGLTSAQVFGGASTASPPPPPPPPSSGGVVLTSSGPGDTLVGGAGNDTLNASRGSDLLTGGGGADRFVFGDVPWSPAHITDFTHGQDVLDLRAVLAHSTYVSGDPVAQGYLSFISDGAGGTKVLFDADGPATGQPWASYILNLDHVAPSSMTAADWIIK